MRTSDVIKYVAKLNMNLMVSMFSPWHVKRWRDKNKKFWLIKENEYQHLIGLFRNREARGVKKIEVGLASVRETMKTAEDIWNIEWK